MKAGKMVAAAVAAAVVGMCGVVLPSASATGLVPGTALGKEKPVWLSVEDVGIHKVLYAVHMQQVPRPGDTQSQFIGQCAVEVLGTTSTGTYAICYVRKVNFDGRVWDFQTWNYNTKHFYMELPNTVAWEVCVQADVDRTYGPLRCQRLP